MASFMDRFIKPDYYKNSDKNRRRPDRYRDDYADRRRDAEKEMSFSQFEEEFGFADNTPPRSRETGYPSDAQRRPAPQPRMPEASQPRPRMQEMPKPQPRMPEAPQAQPRMQEAPQVQPRMPEAPQPQSRRAEAPGIRPMEEAPARPRRAEAARPAPADYDSYEAVSPAPFPADDMDSREASDMYGTRRQSRRFADDFDSFDSYDMPAEERKAPEEDFYFDSFDEPYDMPAREAATAMDTAEAEVIPMPRQEEAFSYEQEEPVQQYQRQEYQQPQEYQAPQQDYRLASVLENVAEYLEELQTENSESKEENKKNQEMIEQINELIGETVINLQGMQQGFQDYVQNSHNEENYQAVMAQTQILDEKVENLTVLLQEIIRDQEERPDIAERLEEQNRILEEMSIQIKESQEVVQNLEGRFDQLKEELMVEQKEMLNDKEKTRRKDFAITRTYFRTIMWLLLIVIVMLGAWLLGFIGPVGSTATNPAAILLGLLTL